MRTIGVVTVARSDYGIYRPLLKRIESDPDLELAVFVSGMHLLPEFGHTVEEVEADGFPIAARVETLTASDTPAGTAAAMGNGLIGFSRVFADRRPDLLLVLGDRFEMHAAALAALPFQIPVGHIHGGEMTQGAFDDALRHSLTKLSHLHFVAMPEYGRRVVQLGEAPWRVHVTGALSLDNLSETRLVGKGELADSFGICLDPAPLLVTFHPATLEQEKAGSQAEQLLQAIEDVGHPAVFTLPNADPEGRAITWKIRDFVSRRKRAWMVASFGSGNYFSMMNCAAAMVGNSSSGIIEAASFRLPVVNIGTRQQGRVRASNVIDVDCRRADIAAGIRRALDPVFRSGLGGLVNPYGDGNAAGRMVERLKNTPLNRELLMKVFFDLPAGETDGR